MDVALVTRFSSARGLIHAGTGHGAAMLLFFSNRLGCLGSLLLSAVVSAVLVLMLWR